MVDRFHVNEYYSGAQVRVYFGHLLIDEIASIEWAGTSTKRPVYGYASTTFDAVAHGQYLCQGAFLMPFKEVGFLYAVQRSLSNRGAASQRIVDAIKSQNQQAQSVSVSAIPDTGGLSPRNRVVTQFGTGPTGTERVETLVTTLTPEDVLDEEASKGGQSFVDLVEALQSTIWDTPGSSPESLVRPDAFDLDPETGFVQRGFNILVTFGDVNNPKQPSTVKSLIDVHLTGDQRVIATDGNPIFERYTFFCRATDETLGQYRIIPDKVGAPTTDPAAAQETTPIPRTGYAGTVPLPAEDAPEGTIMNVSDRGDEQQALVQEMLDRMARQPVIPPVRESPSAPNVSPPRPPARPHLLESAPTSDDEVTLGPRSWYVAHRATLPRPLVGRVASPAQAAAVAASMTFPGLLPRAAMNAFPFKTGETIIVIMVETDTRGATWYRARNDQSIYARIWEGWFIPD